LPAAATLQQLMLDLIHPASNDLLLAIFRGGPKDEGEWAAVRRSALALAESGNLLLTRSRSPQAEWMKDTKLLVDAGAAAYKAARAKDTKALADVAEPLDRSCTTCHRQFRPNLFPREGASK
jgi:hypothetical protein